MNAVLELMKEFDLPMTVEQYMALASGKPFDEWTDEELADIPEELKHEEGFEEEDEESERADAFGAANWEEHKHPRGHGGKFASKGGGEAPAAPEPQPQAKPAAASAPAPKATSLEAYKPGLAASGLEHAADLKAQWRATAPKSVDDHYRVAEANQRVLASAAHAAVQKVDHGCKFKDPGIKGKERVAEKIKGGKAPDQLNDIVRGGFDAPTPELADQLIQEFTHQFEVADEGWFRTDAGYFDRKSLVRFKNGQVAELQIWPPGMLDAKSKGGGHKLYEEARKLKDTDPRRVELQQQMIDLYNGVMDTLPRQWRSLFE
jgi:hypothetical protein